MVHLSVRGASTFLVSKVSRGPRVTCQGVAPNNRLKHELHDLPARGSECADWQGKRRKE